ncbi:thioesterase domain-containing protein [Streptomyces sp. NPDC005302]|uniref:thioesterase II family protein n=1 Tax=Streptomyces sp. NPDC005302 TaxID=3154675 RepID=UPI0033A8B235
MHRTQEPQEPQVRLFVFHHAGGSHLAYRDWPACFPAGWQVHLPDAPGRGPRDGRPALHDATALVDHYRHTLDATMSGRFAFFGHSLGAMVAYELTRRLIDEGRTPPLWLGISARDPFPAVPQPHPHGGAAAPNATGRTGTAGMAGMAGMAGTAGTAPATDAPFAAGTAYAPFGAGAARTTAASGTAYAPDTASAAGTEVTTRQRRVSDGARISGSTQDAGRTKARRDDGSAERGRPGGSGERGCPAGSGEAGRGGEGVPETVSPVGGGGRHLLSDAELRCQLAAMGGTPPEVLAHPQLWDLFAPVIRADLRINETWRPRPPAAPLPVPLSVFGGRRDQVAAPHLLGGWARTCEPFLGIRLFDGGHFYFQDCLPDVARHIQDDVRRALLHSRAPSAVTS